uniref:Uncharacterized protein n=1 Tax=Aegilops tauschii subsp. strangulata TaxID=200361 RepID=A0A453DPE3_AEGTS
VCNLNNKQSIRRTAKLSVTSKLQQMGRAPLLWFFLLMILLLLWSFS